MKVTILGAGHMGTAMARRLIDPGHLDVLSTGS
jgi:3-hydroxyisobutyrate dehydrogenase-like beta-hydroxyacid dehydrogenase